MKPLMPWELDLRSLGAFRIVLGLAMLLQIGWRLANVEWWYAPDGFAGQSLRDLIAGFPDLSPFAGAGVMPVKVVLALSIPLALLLTLGLYARPAAWALAVIFGALQVHSPIFLGNELMVLLWSLVWAGMLPVERAFAVHAQPLQETTVSSPAALGLTVQIGLVYTMNGLYKDAGSWGAGTVLRDLLVGGMYNRPPFSQMVLALPDGALKALTVGVLQLERIALPALLLPNQWVRLLIVLALMGFHLGSGAVMVVGLYPLMSLAWLTALLPPMVWGKSVGTADGWKPGATAVALGTLVYVVWVNVAGLVGGLSPVMDTRLKMVGLSQSWNNFTAPNVTTGVPIFVAQTRQGEIDLYRWGVARNGTDVLATPPADYNLAYGGKWWNWFAEPQRKVIVSIVESGKYEGFALPVAYLCRKWNAKHPEQAVSRIEVKFNSATGARDLWHGKCIK